MSLVISEARRAAFESAAPGAGVAGTAGFAGAAWGVAGAENAGPALSAGAAACGGGVSALSSPPPQAASSRTQAPDSSVRRKLGRITDTIRFDARELGDA